MIKKVLKIIPSFFVEYFLYIINIKKLYQDYLYDLKRFKKKSATFSLKKSKQLEGKIMAHCHVIEKGLSYKNIRLGFGIDALINLIELLREYSDRGYNLTNKQYVIAISIIKQYIELHEDADYEILNIKKTFKDIKKPVICNMGGSLELTKKGIHEKSKIDFKQFALSRYSIRDFTTEEVTIKLIESAIKIAQKSPSVCNRQTSRVYVITDKDNIKKHLSYQSGNRGFGHKINKLLVITSDLSFFEGSFERNQSFVDAGIFSMSLLNAIHYLDLGAVTLNWCVNKQRDKDYRKFSEISDSENIILMIGIGHIPETLTVPKSERKELKEIIRYI